MSESRKILCPSILNLAIDNIREEIEKLDATDMELLFLTSLCLYGS